MKSYNTDKIRNVVLVGHGTSGKTTLADAILYTTKEISRVGDITAGTTTMDYSEAEKKREISINLGLGHGEWRESRVTLIDTPGYDDLVGEMAAGMAAADGAVLTANAAAGIESGTERAFAAAQEFKLPVVIAVTMMDKENVSFEKVVAQAQDLLSPKAVPLQLPIGEGPDFRGLVDLFKMKAFIYQDGGSSTEEEIPADMADAAQAARDALIEAVADFDDEVIEKYLEGQALTDKEILGALKKAVAKAGAFPMVVTSSLSNRGIRRLLDTLVVTIPSPEDRRPVMAKVGDEDLELTSDPTGPFAAQIFKTVVEPHVGEMYYVRVWSGKLTHGSDVYNTTRDTGEKVGQIYLVQGKDRAETQTLSAGEIGALVKLKDTRTGDSLSTKANQVVLPSIPFPEPTSVEAVVPVNKGDEDKIGVAIHKVMEEDPTVRLTSDPELHQQLLECMGELHMEIVLDKLREKNVQVEFKKPRIHFRETIKKVSQGQGRYKKQTGGRGQFGDVWLKLEPLPRDTGFEFENKIVGGVVPGKFIPAVEKGLVEAKTKGVLAGYPVVDFRATLYDGSHHAVDSSENAFKMAASMAFRKLMEESAAVMLEPIMELEVYAPEESTGDVMGDLSSRRGKILGMEPQGHGQIIKAHVPQAELYRYSAKLRSFTQGRGRFKVEFYTYEEIPRDQASRIIADAKAALEESA